MQKLFEIDGKDGKLERMSVENLWKHHIMIPV